MSRDDLDEGLLGEDPDDPDKSDEPSESKPHEVLPTQNASGQGANPGRTQEDQLEERIELTYRLLSDGMRKSDIKRALRDAYGVCARTAENYLARARELQLLDLREERDVHRGASLAFYRRILTDPTAKISDKLHAQKRIDDLLGLAVPFRIAMQIREQTQMPTESSFDEALELATDEELEVLRRVYERASQNPPTLEPPGKDPPANL
ncbi:MAG: hypothetical protein ACKN82_04235 [Pirellula sp.]